MPRVFFVLVAFSLVIGAGVVNGLRTDRWSLSSEPAASAAKLEELPKQLGEWKGEDKEIEAADVELAEIVGYRSLVYRNTRTRKAVSVVIMCGRPGPIAVHTPNICLGGAGFKVTGETQFDLPSTDGMPPAKFKTARFTREGGVDAQKLRVLWAWTTDGTWSAPNDSRWKFASSAALFKMYVTWEEAGSEGLSGREPGFDLVRLLLKDLHARLAPSS